VFLIVVEPFHASLIEFKAAFNSAPRTKCRIWDRITVRAGKGEFSICTGRNGVATMPTTDNWLAPPETIHLEKNEIHIWRSPLNPITSVVESLQATLSEDEHARAIRFFFDRDRIHFIVARGILRELLGKYLDAPPVKLRFNYDPHGKPLLRGGDYNTDLRFNVSHSNGLAVFAFAIGREVGIDVELIRSSFACTEIAEHFFSIGEREELRALPREAQAEGFFNCWTRKEAYVKARGEGLQIPLDEFDVSLTPGDPATLRSADGDRWSIHSFEPQNGWAGAVVAEGKNWGVVRWDWMTGNSE
jgi:4'-phosphopantetheinyl transferase